MKKSYTRVCVYPKDIQIITGKSYRQSLRIMQKIKTALNKTTNQMLTLDDLCLYFGIRQDEVRHLL